MTQGLTRRGFFGHIAVAAAAMTTGTAAAIVNETSSSEENADLLRLGADLHGMVQSFEVATVEKTAARQRFEVLKPEVPAVMIVAYPDSFARDFAESERDIEGKFVSYVERGMCRAREIVRSWHLNRAVKDTDGRTARGKRIRKLLPIAVGHETAVEEAAATSGWRAADGELRAATMDLIRLADQACSIEAMTIKGLDIQAQAFLAAFATGEDAMFHPTRWGPQIARSVANVARQAAPSTATAPGA